MDETASRVFATITDVAAMAGVSKSTVSRVLNGNPSVNTDISCRVVEVAQQMGYVPNPAGRALRRRRSDALAAIVPDMKNAFYTELVAVFERVASNQGHPVMLCNSDEDADKEREYVAAAATQRMSGVLIAATSESTQVGALAHAGIPVVAIDRRFDFDGDLVSVDNLRAGRLAAEHLLDLGCRTVCCVAGDDNVSSTSDRVQGFCDTMRAAGHAVTAGRRLRTDLREHSFGEDAAATAIRSLLERNPDIDAIFATNGPLTAAAFQTLKREHREVPTQVRLVGVDDVTWTQMVTPTVTVVRLPIEQLGTWAANLLLAKVRGEHRDHTDVMLRPTLVVRQSTVG